MLRLFLLLTVLLLGQSASFAPTRQVAPSRSSFSSPRGSAPFLALASTKSSSSSEETTKAADPMKNRRVAILLCPAQFCVPNDYDVLFDNLHNMQGLPNTIGTCRVAPLPRTEWIKVARKLPTKEFLQAKLPVYSTLKWYFDAIERGLAEIFAQEGDDISVCIIGHSIGGWVARAYLGGLSRSSSAVYRLATERCTSLITLGTPHISPEDALVDQTRGLLREIEESEACRPQVLANRGIDITCVCSSGMSGNFLTTNVEEIVAASSYLPLLGRLDASIKGDGIVPLDLAFMEEPARKVLVEECTLTKRPVRHSHVVPTPWNLYDGYAPSIDLPAAYPSYISEGVLPQWAKYIQ